MNWGRGGAKSGPTSVWLIVMLGVLVVSMLLAGVGVALVRTGYLTIDSRSGASAHPSTQPRPLQRPAPDPSGHPVAAPAATPATSLAHTVLQAEVSAALAGTRSCAVVQDGSTPVVEDQPSAPLASASTQKLLLAAAALSALGPNYRFQTSLVSNATPVGGVLSEAWLVGAGDPLLATPDYAAYLASRPRWRTAPVTPLGSLADQLVADQIRSLPGGIHGDDTALSQQRYLPEWTSADRTEGDISPVSALTVDEGWRDWPAYHPVADPAAAGAARLAGLLKAKGVASGGSPVSGLTGGAPPPAQSPAVSPAPAHPPAKAANPVQPASAADAAAPDGAAPPGASVLASVTSAPLAEIVAFMLRSSDNVTAEVLTRELGLKVIGTGTTAAGTQAVRQVDQSLGIPTAGVATVDGSGLAASNRVTCSALLAALDLASRPGFEAIGQGLAVPGQSGTLASQFLGTPEQSHLAAKTGNIDGVAALVGTLDLTQPLRFALVANGRFSYAGGTAVEDKVLAVLAAYKGP